MKEKTMIQLAGAALLLAGGVLVARAARAQNPWGEGNGWCPADTPPHTSEDFDSCGGNPGATMWGDSCRLNGSYVISGTDSYGNQYMEVNNGGAPYPCIEGAGWDNNNYRCVNHDSTADGTSVYDDSGGCNGSIYLGEYFFYL